MRQKRSPKENLSITDQLTLLTSLRDTLTYPTTLPELLQNLPSIMENSNVQISPKEARMILGIWYRMEEEVKKIEMKDRPRKGGRFVKMQPKEKQAEMSEETVNNETSEGLESPSIQSGESSPAKRPRRPTRRM